MRKFTKLMLTLAMFAGSVASAYAEDEITELTADMFQVWDGFGSDASPVGEYKAENNIGNEISGGATVLGDGSVFGQHYADLTGCSKMLFEGSAGTPLRVLFNRQSMDGSSTNFVEKNPTIGDDGTAELDLTEFSYVHLNVIKIGWGGTGTITAIKLVKPADPLELPKETLKKAIASAKMQNPVAKTAESFAALTKAIEEAQAALAAEDATEESLKAATEELNKAIDGLELAAGYTNLTADMFYSWNGAGADAETVAPAEGVVIALDQTLNGGNPIAGLGTGSVPYSVYADLTAYSKIVFAGTSGLGLRVLLNREEGEGEGGSFVEKNPEIGEDGTAELDLTEYPYAHLNVIKANWGPSGVITGIYLYNEGATDINTVATQQESNVVYDLMGRRVAQPGKGLYIVNGKKCVIR